MNTAMREIGKMKKKKKKHDNGRWSEQFVRVTDKNNMLIVGQSKGMNY